MNPETIFAIIAYAIGMVYICRGIDETRKARLFKWIRAFKASWLHQSER